MNYRAILITSFVAMATAAMIQGCTPESAEGRDATPAPPPDSETGDRTAQAASRPAVGASEFPNDWYFYGDKRAPALRALEGKPAIELKVKDWIGQPQKVTDLKGKVVIVDFWGVWCPPCMRA